MTEAETYFSDNIQAIILFLSVTQPTPNLFFAGEAVSTVTPIFLGKDDEKKNSIAVFETYENATLSSVTDGKILIFGEPLFLDIGLSLKNSGKLFSKLVPCPCFYHSHRHFFLYH